MITSETDVTAFASGSGVQLFAGTAWLFAHESLDGGAAPMIGTLVTDEAGQVSLADALAMGRPRATARSNQAAPTSAQESDRSHESEWRQRRRRPNRWTANSSFLVDQSRLRCCVRCCS